MERPIYEVFLVLNPVSSRLSELAYALEPLVNGEPTVSDLDLFHRASADTALVALHYDERDSPAMRCAASTTSSARLGADHRRSGAARRRGAPHLFESRLAQFEACGRGLTTVHEVIATLATRLGINAPAVVRATPRDGVASLRAPTSHETPPAGSPRLVVTVPPLPSLHARHGAPPARPPTLPPPPPDESRGTTLGKINPRRATVNDRLALSLAEQAKLARQAAEAALRAQAADLTDAVDDHTVPMPSAVPTPIPVG